MGLHESQYCVGPLQAIKFPQFAFPHLLDLLGKKADNPIVELYQRRFPYHRIEPDDNRGTVDFILPG
jgi:hypoxia up-regulated 1